ncbi:MAG: tetratricopeptide repeat protein [Planctomycetota bacterium]
MKRFLLSTLLVLALGAGAFAVWMRGDDGGLVALSEDQVQAARDSGAGAREIAVEASEGRAPLPTIEELKDVVERGEMDAIAARVRDDRADASGEERALLTVLLAEVERLRGNFDDAVELGRAGAAALPENSRARSTFARALGTRLAARVESGGMSVVMRSLDDVKLYQAELQAAIDLDPANVDARIRQIITLAFAQWPVGNKKRAAALIEELEPYGEFRRDFWRAQLLVAKKRTAEALAAFQALDERKPDDKDVVYNIGELQRQAESWRDAAATYDRLVIEPRNARAYQALYQGAKARELGGFDLDAALAMLDEVRETNPVGEMMPSAARVDFHRGVVLTKLARYEEAREALERVLADQPQSARARKALEELAALAGNG